MDVTGTVNTKDPDQTHMEVKRIYNNLFGLALIDKVDYTLEEVVKLFDGRYPGYQRCDTKYHDLEHVLQAYLAMARMFDGLIRQNPAKVSKEFVVLGLISALLHDTGYIKEKGDIEGTGAKYTLIHIERSNQFMEKFLPQLSFTPREIQQAQNIVSCTGLPRTVDLAKINFTSEEEKISGYVLGTADLLGQMSDPDYVEKLPILYEEYKEGGVPGYNSAQDLIEQTPKFFEDYVIKLFTEDFHSVYQFAAVHFGGKDLYMEGIKKNIEIIRKRFLTKP